MPQLKEILHALVSDIATAKSLANHTSVRQAELYKSHPLLSSLPAPQMRLTKISLDLPLLIEAVVPGIAGETADPAEVASSLRGQLAEDAKARGIALTNADLDAFQSGFLNYVKSPAAAADRLQGTGVREAFSRAVDLSLTDLSKDAKRPGLFDQLGPVRHELKHAAASSAVVGAGEPSITVDVRTDVIRTTDPSRVTRIHLELAEEGFEWQRETDGPKRKLIPE